MSSVSSVVAGVVVVDATFLKYLGHPESVARIEANCKAAGLQVHPSVPNVLEALKHPVPSIRTGLVSAIRRWAGGRPLLPWPPTLLRLAGEALAKGDLTFRIPSTDLDLLVDHPDQMEKDSAKSIQFLAEAEANFSESFADSERDVRELLKSAGARDRWQTASEFLDEVWNHQDSLEEFASGLWGGVGIKAPFPGVHLLLKSEPWRLTVEALGAAMYFRNIRRKKQGNPAGMVDLGQLSYLTTHTRSRMMITDDESLYETADAVLRGRYPNVRLLRGKEFLEA